MSEKLTAYDPADTLDTPESVALFIADALETDDVAYIAKAIGVAARAKGMTSLSADSGIAREQLYRSFSEQGNPTLKSVLAVLKAMNIKLTAKVDSEKAA